MAATKYQVLYRYINESTNVPITNSLKNEYEMTREFYVDPGHKIFDVNDTVAQEEAMTEQQEMIAFANNSDNPKMDMLFAYNGTKKVRHKKWVPEATGYVVRDWKQIKRDKIGNKGDFTKEFTTLGANTPEDGGTVVCNQKVFEKEFPNVITVASGNDSADCGTGDNKYFSRELIESMILNSTYFSLVNDENPTIKYENFAQPSNARLFKENRYYNGDYYEFSGRTIYTGPVAIEGNAMALRTSAWDSVVGQFSEEHLYKSVIVKPSQVQTVPIPGHYEESMDAPFLIIDTYERIMLSPWFVNTTCNSLEAALTKAKLLVDALGIENVKLIKIVPFDQFVKIK